MTQTAVSKKELVEAMKSGDVRIKYRKLSEGGKMSEIVGTLRSDQVSQYPTKGNSREADDVVHFIAPDRQGWRSVNINTVVSFERA